MKKNDDNVSTNPIDRFLNIYQSQREELAAAIVNPSIFLYMSKANQECYFTKFYKDKTPLAIVGMANEKESWAFPTKNKLVAISSEVFRGYLSDQSIISLYEKEIQEKVKILEDIYEKYSYERIKELNSDEKFCLIRRIFDLIWEGNAAGLFTLHFDKEFLLSELKKIDYKLSLHQVDAVWDRALTPVYGSFEEDYKIAFCTFVVQGEVFPSLAEKCQYFYSSYGGSKSLEWIEKELRNEYGEYFNQKAARDLLNQVHTTQQSRHSVYTRWLSELGKKQKILVEYIQKIIRIRDTRKSFVSRGFTIIWRIAENIVKEAGISKKAIPFLTVDDFFQDIAYFIKNKEKIENRKKGFCCYDDYEGQQYSGYCDFEKERDRILPLFRNREVDRQNQVYGEIGSSGKVTGRCKVILKSEDAIGFTVGEILVAGMTRSDYLPLMKRAAAFVTDEGGITCHAAIVARELKKPCIIGTKIATQVLKDGDMVEVDADNGVVTILKKAKI